MIRPLYLLLWIKKAPVHIRIVMEEAEIAKYILRVSLKFLSWTNLKNYMKWKSYLSNFSLSTGNEIIENFRNTQLIDVCFFLAQQCCLVWNSLYNKSDLILQVILLPRAPEYWCGQCGSHRLLSTPKKL